jgi:dTDP-4-amino-4,6-dideoxygalactose transaminase
LGLDRHLGLPQVARGCQSVWNQYTIRVPGGRRDALVAHLAAQKVGSAVYYPVPLHLQKCFAELGCQPGSLPVTEQAAAEVLSLPIYAELTMQEQDRVIQALAEFCGIRYTAADVSRAA